jgi:DNA-binding GntR family transcriptional regulator
MFSNDMALQALSVLEESATALSVPLLTERDLVAARTMNAQMAECVAQAAGERYGVLGHELHELLYSRCPNRRLLELVRVQAAQIRAVAVVHPVFSVAAAKQSVHEHEVLFDLVETHSICASEVARRSRTHRLRTMRIVHDDMIDQFDDLLAEHPNIDWAF